MKRGTTLTSLCCKLDYSTVLETYPGSERALGYFHGRRRSIESKVVWNSKFCGLKEGSIYSLAEYSMPTNCLSTVGHDVVLWCIVVVYSHHQRRRGSGGSLYPPILTIRLSGARLGNKASFRNKLSIVYLTCIVRSYGFPIFVVITIPQLQSFHDTPSS
jgi:hypothetical protein